MAQRKLKGAGTPGGKSKVVNSPGSSWRAGRRLRGGGGGGRGREAGRARLHGENHLVNLPLEAVVDAELGEEVHHVGVCAEEDVEAGFYPVAVLVLPGRHLTAQDVAGFVHDRSVPSVNKILRSGQSRQSTCQH